MHTRFISNSNQFIQYSLNTHIAWKVHYNTLILFHYKKIYHLKNILYTCTTITTKTARTNEAATREQNITFSHYHKLC